MPTAYGFGTVRLRRPSRKMQDDKVGLHPNLILNRTLTPKYQIVIDSEEIKGLLSQYGKIGSNLNQIARYFNSGGERSRAMQEEIQRCIAELYALRKEVLRLAGDYSGSSQTHKEP